MPTVTDVKINLVQNTTNTFYGSWKFSGGSKSTTTTTTSNIVKGDWVKVKSGAKSYNGTTLASFVFDDEWQVIQVSGNRVVIDKNRSGSNSIMTPVNIKDLTKLNSDGSTSSASSNETVDTCDHYELMWSYYTGSGPFFHGADATTYNIEGAYDGAATYSPPEEAIAVGLIVTPISKTYKVDDKDVHYWTGTSSPRTVLYLKDAPIAPDTPSAPSLELDELDMTVELDVDDERADVIQFEIYDGTTLYKTAQVNVSAGLATYKTTANTGGSYRARARAGFLTTTEPSLENGGGWAGSSMAGETGVYPTGCYTWSDWGPYSGSSETIPAAPTGITTIRAASSTSVYLAWGAVDTADTYDIEYTDNPTYFEGSNATTTISNIETTQYTITGLESGDEYYFRVRSVNDQGHSDWTAAKSVIIGKAPAAPTTWSSATTVIVGDPLNLYWVHNAEDGSWATYSQLEMYIDDVKQAIETIESDQSDDPDDDDDTEKTHHYAFDTTKHPEGTVLKWRVRTAGITKEFGDWSIQRQVNIYAQPTLSLSVTNQNGDVFDTLTSFPFNIDAFAGPATQEPIGYHVRIINQSTYETTDQVGIKQIIKAGTEVYSKYFQTNAALDLTLYPQDVDLANGQNYTIYVMVSMNTGLTAESSRSFDVSWVEEVYEPDTEIAIDFESYTAYLIPFCRDENGASVPNVTLSLYRREYNGTYTEIATGIDPFANTMVTDPHPSLDYARYRVVAISTITGAVSFYDPPGYPISTSSREVPVIIQWNEAWQNFNTTNPDASENPMWSGSMVQIPWNIKVSENAAADVTLVNYIGRTYPVSYYGDSIATTASWNFEFPKTDTDTIYALRRLQIWKGDVYVREPSGIGYWANVVTNFNLDYDSLIVPVTLDITRVEGGM